ncbi:MAG: hypothetical protein CVV27_06890 [Candidatus Melainabacteria bacterium HGW-Melainabacteria-1]|nr:MAG: hypothetical protein CVV27_06890 [Candidatus Melainabacteria bacterium HGW-Melainabacteria-1]
MAEVKDFVMLQGEEINRDQHRFVTEFADLIVAKDYQAAHGRLASWVQAFVSPAQLQDLLERDAITISNSLGGPDHPQLHPTCYQLYFENIPAEEFSADGDCDGYGPAPREPGEPLDAEDLYCGNWVLDDLAAFRYPPETNQQSYLNEVSIEFLPSQHDIGTFGFDGFFMLRLVLVKEDEQIRIGYFEVDIID